MLDHADGKDCAVNRITPEVAASLTFEQLLDELETVTVDLDLKNLIQAFVHQVGYDYFLCSFQYPLRRNFVLNTYPAEWVRVYQMKRYITIDPVVPRGKLSYFTYDWAELPFNPKSIALFQDAMQHGIFGGFSVPARGPASCDLLLNVATSKPQMLNGMRKYDIFVKSMYFAAKVLAAGSRVLEAAETAPMVTASEITPRQKQCLQLLAQGLSAKEIGRELDNISSGRVYEIVESLQKKFGVSTREELVARAGILNFIAWEYIPEVLTDLSGQSL